MTDDMRSLPYHPRLDRPWLNRPWLDRPWLDRGPQ